MSWKTVLSTLYNDLFTVVISCRLGSWRRPHLLGSSSSQWAVVSVRGGADVIWGCVRSQIFRWTFHGAGPTASTRTAVFAVEPSQFTARDLLSTVAVDSTLQSVCVVYTTRRVFVAPYRVVHICANNFLHLMLTIPRKHRQSMGIILTAVPCRMFNEHIRSGSTVLDFLIGRRSDLTWWSLCVWFVAVIRRSRLSVGAGSGSLQSRLRLCHFSAGAHGQDDVLQCILVIRRGNVGRLIGRWWSPRDSIFQITARL